MSDKKQIPALQRFFALTFFIGLCVGLDILVKIYGWGLTPQNWWWIIGVGFFVSIILRIFGDYL